MKWIKYKILQCVVGEDDVFIDKKIEYNDVNLAIAQSEAYGGTYSIEEDGQGESTNIPMTNAYFGSYIGSGEYNKSKPNSITFEFIPKMVIFAAFGGIVVFYGDSVTYYTMSDSRKLNMTWSGKTLTWYSTDSASSQLNSKDVKYEYAVFG